ncbi:MAG: alpha-glucan family phosphorylase [Verrucomicrobiae bacterium]|nr:alpha-glucan family phosphorylase [Verrucomicrobiae bacterium]MDW7980740.1 alpha-glucan family phosphorylase [Verrucomicrobiales bacterium]
MIEEKPVVAYFSMEFALEEGMPTYAGGLGVLAGDTVRAAADLQVPMVGVTLLHRKGYFYQRLDSDGRQIEEPVRWPVDDFLQEQPQRVEVSIEGRPVRLRAWKYEVKGVNGFVVPVYFLDSDLPENSEWDRALTDYLYGGDEHYRLCQEVLLGIGGVRMLRALGYTDIARFHMNEGHSAMLTLELLRESAQAAGRTEVTSEDIERVRRQCVFTTHTPVMAGHDRFALEHVRRVLGDCKPLVEHQHVLCLGTELNMTYLALSLSHFVNGVAKKHAEISRHMFAEYQIDAITNGVHVASWASPHFQALFDKYIPGWREDNFSLRYALSIPADEVWAAHRAAKRDLLVHVNRETNAGMDMDILTIGFARRATAYKRADLLFRDLERLRAIATKVGRLQIIYAGKAHPRDHEGKSLIQRIFRASEALKNDIRIVYMPNYDVELARLLIPGVDVWLNTPQPPLEASGTSGMKAAVNGVPSLSILDGWWIEGCIEGVTGWAIGERVDATAPQPDRSDRDAAALYEKLEKVVVPLFYTQRERFIDVMRHAIALNGSFFNTHRMLQQYVVKAYFE